jgi:hypothetical protein
VILKNKKKYLLLLRKQFIITIFLILTLSLSCSNHSEDSDNLYCYFESSFETATGKSDNALLDGGIWTDHTTGGIEYMEVLSELVINTSDGTVTVHPVDGNNMLSIGANGNEYENVRVENYIREEDEHTYMRFYMMMLAPNIPVSNLHGIQDIYCHLSHPGSFYFWVFHPLLNLYENGWKIGFVFRSPYYSSNPEMLDYFNNGCSMWGNSWEAWFEIDGQRLDYYRWYRIETHIHWLSEKSENTPVLYYMRVYDDTKTLVVDNNNLYTWGFDYAYQNVRTSVNELYSIGNDFRGRRFFVDATHNCLMFGVNGNGCGDEPRLYLIDKVSFSSDDWIGE